MTNPTLERAARALAEIDGLDWDDMGKGSNPILSEFQDDYLLQARAVLMAVREPDEAIVRALWKPSWTDRDEPDFPASWRSAINSIIGENDEN